MGNQDFTILSGIKKLPTSLVVSTILIPVVLFYFGWELATGTGVSTTVYVFSNSAELLTTIARGLSTLFGITFSVLFLGIQLVSTRYTERVVKFLLSDSVLHIVLLIFVVSISLPLWILYNASDLNSPFSVGLIFASSGLAFLTLIYLYVFAKRILRETTPERLLNRAIESTDMTGELEKQIRTENRVRICGLIPVPEFISRSQAQENSEHPTIHLSSMVTSSLQDERHQDAENIFDQYVLTLFQEINSWDESAADAAIWSKNLEPILCDQMPSIVKNGAISGSSGVMRKAIATQRQLYLHANSCGLEVTPSVFQDGYVSVMSALPLTHDTKTLYREILVQMCSGVSEAISLEVLPKTKADRPAHIKDLPLVLETVGEQIDDVLDESVDNDLIYRVCIGLLEELVPLQTHLLKLREDLEETASKGIAQGWRGEGLKPRLISEWGTIVMRVSIGLVEIRHDMDRTISYKQIWRKICVQSVVHSSSKYPSRVIFSMIELIIIDVSNSSENVRDQVIHNWAETLAQIQLKVGKGLISDEIEAFRREMTKRQDGYISESETHDVFVNYKTKLSTADINAILHQLEAQTDTEYRRISWEAEDITNIRHRAARARLSSGWTPVKFVSNDAFRVAPRGMSIEKYFKCMKTVAKSDLSSLREQSDRIASRKSEQKDIDYTILVAEKPNDHVKEWFKTSGINIEPLELEDLEGQKHLTLDYFITPATTAYTVEIDGYPT